MEDTSEICCLCNLKLDGYLGVSEVCHAKSYWAHDACVETSYASYCDGNAYASCPCGNNHFVISLVPRYIPSMHHAPWLRLFGYASNPYIIVGDTSNPHDEVLMHSPNSQSVESLRSTVNPAEFRVASWSKRMMSLVFCLSVIGIIVMAFIGAIDWRVEIAFWTTLAVLFLLATVLAPESASYFWIPGGSSRGYARSYNKRMLYAHLGVFAAFGLSYTIMMSLSSNNYSHIWNGVTTFSVGFIVAYLLYKRYSYVSYALSMSRFIWYAVRKQGGPDSVPAKSARKLAISSEEDIPAHAFSIDEAP